MLLLVTFSDTTTPVHSPTAGHEEWALYDWTRVTAPPTSLSAEFATAQPFDWYRQFERLTERPQQVARRVLAGARFVRRLMVSAGERRRLKRRAWVQGLAC